MITSIPELTGLAIVAPSWTSWWVNCIILTTHVISLYISIASVTELYASSTLTSRQDIWFIAIDWTFHGYCKTFLMIIPDCFVSRLVCWATSTSMNIQVWLPCWRMERHWRSSWNFHQSKSSFAGSTTTCGSQAVGGRSPTLPPTSRILLHTPICSTRLHHVTLASPRCLLT